MMVLKRFFRSSKRSASYALGLFFIFLVAVIWAGASVLIQHIYIDMHFESPFLLTFICTSLFSIYLPWTLLCAKLGWGENPPLCDPVPGEGVGGARYTTVLSGGGVERRGGGGSNDSSCNSNGNNSRIDELPLRAGMDSDSSLFSVENTAVAVQEHDELTATSFPSSSSPPPQQRWSHLKTLRTAVIVFPLFFIANFSYNVSLAHTSVTSNTIISTTSSLWTFFFSTCRGLEAFAWTKMGGLLLSMGGTVLVGLADRSEGGNDTLGGDVICLFAAVMYGVYTTALRVLVPDDSSVSFQLLFGYIGLLSLLLLLPPTLLLLATHTFPSMFDGMTMSVLGFIVLNGLADNVLSDYLWARSIVLTSPTVATVGLSLTIPLAFLSDAAMGKLRGGWEEVVGALAVAAGFGLVSWKEKGQVEQEQEEEEEGRKAVGGLREWEGGMGEEEEEEEEGEEI